MLRSGAAYKRLRRRKTNQESHKGKQAVERREKEIDDSEVEGGKGSSYLVS